MFHLCVVQVVWWAHLLMVLHTRMSNINYTEISSGPVVFYVERCRGEECWSNYNGTSAGTRIRVKLATTYQRTCIEYTDTPHVLLHTCIMIYFRIMMCTCRYFCKFFQSATITVCLGHLSAAGQLNNTIFSSRKYTGTISCRLVSFSRISLMVNETMSLGFTAKLLNI